MSNPTVYNIQPLNVVANSFSITSVIVRVGSAIVNVDLYDNGSIIRSRSLLLEGSDLSSWSNNSDWLRDWVVSQLGAVLA